MGKLGEQGEKGEPGSAGKIGDSGQKGEPVRDSYSYMIQDENDLGAAWTRR